MRKPAPADPDPMPPQQVARNTAVALAVIIGSAALLSFLYLIRPILLQLAIAVFLALALFPLVRLLMRRGFGRAGAAVSAVLLTLLVLGLLTAAIASPIITQGDELIHNGPHIIDSATDSPLFHDLNDRFHLIDKLKAAVSSTPGELVGAGSPLLGALGTVIGAVTTTFVVLVLTLFILIEGPDMWHRSLHIIGRRRGHWAYEVARRISAGISGFVTGNLLISLIAAIVSLITLLILRVPYALALSALVAVFDLIPLVGATLATVILAIVALTKGVLTAIIVVSVMIVYQFIEGHFIQPVIYSRTVQLSQLAILIASIIGAHLGGIVGVLLAIPAASTVKILTVELLLLTRQGRQALAEPEVS